MDVTQNDIDSLLGLEAAIGGIKFDNSVPVISEQYISTLLETMQPMFEIAKDLPSFITKLKADCKHRLIPTNIDSTTMGYRCVDCDHIFEAYVGHLEMPDADFMEITSPERK